MFLFAEHYDGLLSKNIGKQEAFQYF